MKRKLISLLAVAAIGIQAIAVPMIANAEESVSYVEHSDFSNVSIGGAAKRGPNQAGYYGLGIIIDGSPWLSKGSASVHYQTFMYDEETKRNYCNFWSNSDKSGGNDGAGSMYFYNRNQSEVNQMGPYGIAEYDIRMHEDNGGNVGFMMGWFDDATSSGFNAGRDVGVMMTFALDKITAMDGSSSITVAEIQPEKWYTVRVTVDIKLEEFCVTVTDKATGAVISKTEDPLAFQASMSKNYDGPGIRTTCWAYQRGQTYNFDLTDVTIGRSSSKYPAKAN